MENSIKDLRSLKGWTQGELGDLLKVSRQTVNALEKGKYDPSLPLAFKLAEVFEKPIEEIFNPEEN